MQNINCQNSWSYVKRYTNVCAMFHDFNANICFQKHNKSTPGSVYKFHLAKTLYLHRNCWKSSSTSCFLNWLNIISTGRVMGRTVHQKLTQQYYSSNSQPATWFLDSEVLIPHCGDSFFLFQIATVILVKELIELKVVVKVEKLVGEINLAV